MLHNLPPAISQKLQQIKLVILDVDGVLTDGKLYFTDSGEEFKSFNVRDGLGMKLLQNSGIEIAVITGRKSPAARNRLQKNLSIKHYFEDCRDKATTLDELLQILAIPIAQTLYVGDDLIDLAVMKKVGVAVAVNDAEELIKSSAHLTLTKKGGEGAVREICELILRAQGKWQTLIEKFNTGAKMSN